MTGLFDGDLADLAEELADGHCEAPEVRASGGPSAGDADTFHATLLAERLRERGLPTNEETIDALRERIRSYLAEAEVAA